MMRRSSSSKLAGTEASDIVGSSSSRSLTSDGDGAVGDADRVGGGEDDPRPPARAPAAGVVDTRAPPRKLCSLPQKSQVTRNGCWSPSTTTTVCIRSSWQDAAVVLHRLAGPVGASAHRIAAETLAKLEHLRRQVHRVA